MKVKVLVNGVAQSINVGGLINPRAWWTLWYLDNISRYSISYMYICIIFDYIWWLYTGIVDDVRYFVPNTFDWFDRVFFIDDKSSQYQDRIVPRNYQASTCPCEERGEQLCGYLCSPHLKANQQFSLNHTGELLTDGCHLGHIWFEKVHHWEQMKPAVHSGSKSLSSTPEYEEHHQIGGLHTKAYVLDLYTIYG